MAARPLRAYQPDKSPNHTPVAPLTFACDPAAFHLMVQAVVTEVIAQLEHDRAALPDDLCFSEAEAARLLKVEPWVLRDERLRGKIGASKIVGRRVRYTRDDLAAYLAGRRVRAE